MIKKAVIVESIRSYEEQFRTLEGQLQNLDTNYNQQRAQMSNTLNQIHGAIVGLQQVLVAAENGPNVPPADEPDPVVPNAHVDAHVDGYSDRL